MADIAERDIRMRYSYEGLGKKFLLTICMSVYGDW